MALSWARLGMDSPREDGRLGEGGKRAVGPEEGGLGPGAEPRRSWAPGKNERVFDTARGIGQAVCQPRSCRQ